MRRRLGDLTAIGCVSLILLGFALALASLGPAAPAPELQAATPIAPSGVVTQVQQVVPPPADTCGDPLASLAPGPMPAPGAMPAGSRMAAIAERGRLIAGVDQNTYRFGFRDPFTGAIEGFAVDIVYDLAEAIFGDRDPSRVQFRVAATVDDRLRLVESGEVDVFVHTTSITCERRERVEFSAVYYQAGQRVLTTKGSGIGGVDDLAGKRVCAAEGSTSMDNLTDRAPEAIQVGVPLSPDCLVLLQLGEVDAISTDDTILAGLRAQDPWTDVVGPAFAAEPYGIVVSKDAQELVRFVNGLLEQRRADGRWTASYTRWLAEDLGPAPEPPAPRYRG